MSASTDFANPVEAAPGSLTAIPGWLASAAMHAALLAILLTTGVPSCNSAGDAVGEPGGDFRQVGLVVKEPETTTEPQDSSDSEVPETSETIRAVPTPPQPAAEQSPMPPVPLSLPQEGPPLLGPGGAPPPVSAAPDVRNLVKPTGPPRVGGTGGVGPGEVQFFGAKDKASQVVYVLDCSGSMSGAPLAEAKARLLASLESLDNTQRFQIIFYNQQTLVMSLRGEQGTELYWATDINRTLARQFISSVDAEAGTDHVPALLKALSFKPEVVYLLTDAEEPQLSALELNRIRLANRGRTRIHTIGFGEGLPALNGSRVSFLEVLAQQNGGTYRYQDVTALRRGR